MFNGTHQKARSSASRVSNFLAQFGVYHIHNKLSYRSWRIKFACVFLGSQSLQNLLINHIKNVMLFAAVKINFVQFVDGLAEGGSAFHIVVGSVKYLANGNAQSIVSRNRKIFECREKFVVHKIDEF